MNCRHTTERDHCIDEHVTGLGSLDRFMERTALVGENSKLMAFAGSTDILCMSKATIVWRHHLGLA